MFLSRIALSLCLLIAFACMSRQARAGVEGGVKLRFSLNSKSADEPVTVTVSGKALDKATGQPIAGALVRGHIAISIYQGPDHFAKCPQLETKTDAAGEYRLVFHTPLTTSGPLKGQDSLCVIANAPGYATHPSWIKGYVSRINNNFPNCDLALEQGMLIKGIVVDKDHRPIPNATVRIDQGLSGAWGYWDALGHTQADASGAFEIRCSTDHADHGGKPWLLIVAPDYGIGFSFGILEKGDLGTIVVPRGGEVAGRVVDTQGKGIANCEVSMFGFPEDPIEPVHTDSEGRYLFRGIFGQQALKDFFIHKNGQDSSVLGVRKIFARPNPSAGLQDAPTCEVTTQDGQRVTAPDLVVGNSASVAGRLLPGAGMSGLKGLLVRRDYDWDRMVETDGDGRFAFPSVPTGKHRLTAYLPTNLRGDRGIGSIEIDVQPQQKINDVKLQLTELAEARVQILDARGNPLEGITAGATATKDGSGFWTEGTRSGADGWSVLYLYPGGPQYLRGFDMNSHKLLAGDFVEVSPKGGEVINNLRVTMVEAASIAGSAQETGGKPIAERKLHLTLHYADETERNEPITTDKHGIFGLGQVKPGVARMSLETVSLDLAGSITQLTEFKPGEVKDVGSITLLPVNLPELNQETLKKLVEEFFKHNFRDVTARKPVAWGEPVKEKDGSFSICHQYEATIWDKEILMMNQVFTFNRKGNFVSFKNMEGFPKKLGQKVPDFLKNIKVDTKEGLTALVENFFKQNYHDITSRKTIEWGEPVKEQNGNYSIRYKAETMIRGKEKKTLNKVFTFDSKGNCVSVKDVADQAASGN